MKTSLTMLLLAGVLMVGIPGCGGLRLPYPLKTGENDWGMFGKTSERINSTSEAVRPPLTLAWSYDISSGMGSGSPIIIDSTVVVTNLRGELYCINANTGKRIGWVTLGDAIQGSPVIDNNMAYVAVANSRESLVAFDLLVGKAEWKREYGDLETTPLMYDNKLFFGNTAGVFFCVSREKGDPVWRFRIPENNKRNGVRSTATVSGDLIIFGAEDGRIYALDSKNGSERWSLDTGAPIFASPAVANGHVYCGNSAGTFVAMNAKNGQLVWQFSAGTSIYATPSFSTGSVFIGTTGGTLYSLNLADGSMAWSRELNSVINSSAVVSGDIAYVGTLKKELSAISTNDGSLIWTQTLEGRIKTSPAVAHGRVYVATDDKKILAFKQGEAN